MGVHVAGHLVDADVVMWAFTPKLVVPFKPARRFSDRGLSLCLATDAAGVESSVAMFTAEASCVNSVLLTHNCQPYQAMWPLPLRTLAPRLPDVFEKNVFRFFRASASGKQHLKLSCFPLQVLCSMQQMKALLRVPFPVSDFCGADLGPLRLVL